MSESIIVAKSPSGVELSLLTAFANRHGLITGATGTGKTVSLQVMAENFSRLGVPTFMADVKGDLAGLAAAGTLTPKLADRLKILSLPEPAWSPSPVVFWDLFGTNGHPVRATISDMGPLVLGRLLGLNETQRGVLTLVFKIADDANLLLLDVKDLRAMLAFVGENAAKFRVDYGNISAASIGTIQRGLTTLDEQGADRFFGEPMLNIDDLIQTAAGGRGVVNILAADKLINSPKVYASFLLWLLSELFEQLPEVGDQPKPKMVFFFDEAHLLFGDAPDSLVEKIEQVVRLIRSKGVGVYFVTQNPLDIPETVLGQLGNRIQHALRAFTPRDQKAVRTAAQTLRQNPSIDTEKVITELGVGEALVSFLDEKGAPTVVERAFILPPASRIGPITSAERAAVLTGSVLKGVYDQAVDRESAYERIKGTKGVSPAEARSAKAETTGTSGNDGNDGAKAERKGLPTEARSATVGNSALNDLLFGKTGPRGGHHEGMLESAAKSAARSIGSGMGRSILRGMLGGIFGGRK